MKYLSTTLALLAPLRAADDFDGVKAGRCPGPVGSNIDHTFSLDRITGSWINFFDEREYKDQYLCQSCRFT